MAKDPGFVFYPGDYLRDTQVLSEKCQVAYDRIMCEHMRNICISQKQLNFFTKRLSEEEKEELLMVLTEVEDGFQISWVAESINKRRAYSESRRKNRQKKKEEDVSNISKTYDKHMDNEDEIEDVNEIEVKDETVIENKLKIDYQKIVDIFNSFRNQMPEVKKITPSRKTAIRLRIKEYGLNGLGEMFQKASNSSFLNGENDRGWIADFDWLMQPRNFIKVYEDNYKNKKNGKSNTVGQSRVQFSESFLRKVADKIQS